MHGLALEARERLLDEGARGLVCASVEIPHHALDVVVMIDNERVQDVLPALVADVVVKHVVVGFDEADLTTHAAHDLHLVLLPFPAFLALELEEDVAVFVPGVEVLVLGDGILLDVDLVKFLSHEIPFDLRLRFGNYSPDTLAEFPACGTVMRTLFRVRNGALRALG